METKNKLMSLGIMWALIILAYILMTVAMPAIGSITDQASSDIQVSANTSNMPGIVGGVESAPVYLWFIPGGIGIVATAIILKRSSS